MSVRLTPARLDRWERDVEKVLGQLAKLEQDVTAVKLAAKGGRYNHVCHIAGFLKEARLELCAARGATGILRNSEARKRGAA